jgi:hypothetical protein
MTDWQVLARGENGAGVGRRPEGHIHLELQCGALALRFDDAQFLSFARTVAEAAAAVSGKRWPNPFELVRDDRMSQN